MTKSLNRLMVVTVFCVISPKVAASVTNYVKLIPIAFANAAEDSIIFGIIWFHDHGRALLL